MALIFTTAYGPGAVVSIGVIVFPIMLSLGISKVLSTASFCMSVGCGLYFNQSLLNQAAGTMVLADGSQFLSTAEEWSQWYGFAAPAFVIHFISIIVMIVIAMHFGKKAHAWAAPAGGAATGKDVNIIACLTPIIPVVLSVTLGFQMIPGIVVAVLWALIFTGSLAQGWSKVCELVQKTFHDGVADVGLVLGFLVFLQMFVKAAGACQDLLAPIVAPILPTDPFALFIVFGVLGFLALYRGPLTIWGAGVATFAIVAASTNLPLAVLYPLFYIPCCTVNTNVCPTQSWNMWAIGYTKISVSPSSATSSSRFSRTSCSRHRFSLDGSLRAVPPRRLTKRGAEGTCPPPPLLDRKVAQHEQAGARWHRRRRNPHQGGCARQRDQRDRRRVHRHDDPRR